MFRHNSTFGTLRQHILELLFDKIYILYRIPKVFPLIWLVDPFLWIVTVTPWLPKPQVTLLPPPTDAHSTAHHIAKKNFTVSISEKTLANVVMLIYAANVIIASRTIVWSECGGQRAHNTSAHQLDYSPQKVGDISHPPHSIHPHSPLHAPTTHTPTTPLLIFPLHHSRDSVRDTPPTPTHAPPAHTLTFVL